MLWSLSYIKVHVDDSSMYVKNDHYPSVSCIFAGKILALPWCKENSKRIQKCLSNSLTFSYIYTPCNPYIIYSDHQE